MFRLDIDTPGQTMVVVYRKHRGDDGPFQMLQAAKGSAVYGPADAFTSHAATRTPADLQEHNADINLRDPHGVHIPKSPGDQWYSSGDDIHCAVGCPRNA